jgi:pyridoxine 4-dehydrogenase
VKTAPINEPAPKSGTFIIDQIKAVRRLAPVVSVQNQYNLADRRSEDVLSYCAKEKSG